MCGKKMKMKLKLLLFVIFGFICLTGCGSKIKYYETIKEEDLISMVKKQAYQEYGEEVNVEIISKSVLKGCEVDFGGGGCVSTKEVKGSYTYKLKVSSIINNEIYTIVYYDDTYIKDGYKVVSEIDLDSYGASKEIYDKKIVINDILTKYKNVDYKLNNWHSDYYIYMYSTNQNEISSVVDELKGYIGDDKLIIYIFFDSNFYNISANDASKIDGKLIKGVSDDVDLNIIEKNEFEENYSQYVLEISNKYCIKHFEFCSYLIGIE